VNILEISKEVRSEVKEERPLHFSEKCYVNLEEQKAHSNFGVYSYGRPMIFLIIMYELYCSLGSYGVQRSHGSVDSQLISACGPTKRSSTSSTRPFSRYSSFLSLHPLLLSSLFVSEGG